MKKQSLFKHLTGKVQRGFKLLLEGYFTVFWREFRKRLYSNSLSLGLHRDITTEFRDPDAKIDISVRLLKEGDLDFLMENGALALSNPRLAAYQEGLVKARIPNCYVAVTTDDKPCYMQWLIGSQENRRIQDHFGDIFPPLHDDEALLEAAFMHRSFRGLRIMPAAMARIAGKAADLGVRRVMTFVAVENIPSLKGCKRAGFAPYILRKDRWFLFRRAVSFEKIPEDVLLQYQHAAAGRAEQPEPAS